MLKNGITGKRIAIQLDESEGHVSNVKKAYEENGIAGINPKHQGRKTAKSRYYVSSRKNRNHAVDY